MALTGADLVTDLDANLFFPAKVLLLSLLFLTSLPDFLAGLTVPLSLDLERPFSTALEVTVALFFSGPDADFFWSATDAILAGFAEDLAAAEVYDFNYFGADFDLDLSTGFVSLDLGLPDETLVAPLSAFSLSLASDFLDCFGADEDLLFFDSAF